MFLERKLVVSGTKKRVVEVADIVTWIEALKFTTLCMILCHTFPFRWKDLNQYEVQYKLLIIWTQQGASLSV